MLSSYLYLSERDLLIACDKMENRSDYEIALRTNRYIAAAWLILLGGYIAAALWLPNDASGTVTNLLLCLMPLLVNGALLINAVTPDWRKRAFWMLLAFGCTLWMAGQSIWTYIEVYQHRPIPFIFNGDIIFFLHTVPMIAALTLQPHKRPDSRKMEFSYVDFGLLLCWWIYLYVFVVFPWQFVLMDDHKYVQAYTVITLFENLVFVGGAALLFSQATGYWRRIYAHLAAARGIYLVRFAVVELAVGRGNLSRGSLYNLPLLISFLWLGSAGVFAYQHRGEEDKFGSSPAVGPQVETSSGDDALWASRLARMALLSLPVIGFWCMKVSEAPAAVREFRMLATIGAVLPLGFLAFLRHELVDRERVRLLRASQDSLDNLKRLQTQFVQSEKLASIGQLVAGAAHEINNPLTAILGYSELLADDGSMEKNKRASRKKFASRRGAPRRS